MALKHTNMKMNILDFVLPLQGPWKDNQFVQNLLKQAQEQQLYKAEKQFCYELGLDFSRYQNLKKEIHCNNMITPWCWEAAVIKAAMGSTDAMQWLLDHCEESPRPDKMKEFCDAIHEVWQKIRKKYQRINDDNGIKKHVDC